MPETVYLLRLTFYEIPFLQVTLLKAAAESL